jgi:hypothetical protein
MDHPLYSHITTFKQYGSLTKNRFETNFSMWVVEKRWWILLVSVIILILAASGTSEAPPEKQSLTLSV